MGSTAQVSVNKSFVWKMDERHANKGGNVVLWPIEKYTQEANRQLGNSRYYAKLPLDPTPLFKKKLDKLLASDRSFGIISKQEHAFLMVDKPVTPTF